MQGKSGAMSGRCTTPAQRAEFFRDLPDGDFNDLEVRTREVLLEWLNNKPTKSFPLMEWVDRRLGGEIATLKDETGQGELRLQPASGPPAAPALLSPDAFFASLPVDFLEEEAALREAIYDFLAGWKSQELAHFGNLVADTNVRQKVDAFVPAGVEFEHWLQRRIGGEVELKLDRKSGNKVIHLTALARPIVTAKFLAMQKDGTGRAGATQKVGGSGVAAGGRATPPATPPPGGKGSKAGGKAGGGKPKVVGMEEWFADLPDDSLNSDEAALRQALLDWLNGARTAPVMFQEAGQDAEIQRCRTALLPSSVPLREWIDRRIGGEIEMRKDPSSGQTEILIRGSRPATEGGKAGGKSNKKEDRLGKGAGRSGSRNAEAAQEEFFKRLPEGELTPAELDLRQGIMNLIDLRNAENAPLLLSDFAKDSEIASMRESLMPAEVNLRMWIERRIGGEVEVSRDDRGQPCLRLRGADGGAGDERPAKVEKGERFFESLPGDKFLPEEERLREALLSFLDNYAGRGQPTLTDAGVNPEVRRWRAAALPKETGVSLKMWIDRRMGAELETVTDASGQFVLGHRGTLDENMGETSKKRPHDDDDRGGNGKGKRSAPWSWRDDDGKGRGGPRRVERRF